MVESKPTDGVASIRDKFKIERNVPLPVYGKMKMGVTIKYPLDKLKPGESFLTEERYGDKQVGKIRARLHTLVKKHELHGQKFSVGKDPIEGENVRVWRAS